MRLILDTKRDTILSFCLPVNADAVIKGTSVDGICDRRNNTLDKISYHDAVSKGCDSMDTMAIQFCEENAIPG